jgi:hypothetical protein
MSDKKRECLYHFCRCFTKPKITPRSVEAHTSDLISKRLSTLERQFVVLTTVPKEKIVVSIDYDEYITSSIVRFALSSIIIL